MPGKLAELSEGRLEGGRVPREYLKRCIASCLASKMCYAEGVMFVEQHSSSPKHLAQTAHDYFRAEAEVHRVLKALDAADWGGKSRVGSGGELEDGAEGEKSEAWKFARQIVADGGVRAFLNRHGGAQLKK